MSKEAIHSDHAPAAIGTYSQAVKTGNLVFLSGQIPLDPATMEFVDGDFEARTRQVFGRKTRRSPVRARRTCGWEGNCRHHPDHNATASGK